MGAFLFTSAHSRADCHLLIAVFHGCFLVASGQVKNTAWSQLGANLFMVMLFLLVDDKETKIKETRSRRGPDKRRDVKKHSKSFVNPRKALIY